MTNPPERGRVRAAGVAASRYALSRMIDTPEFERWYTEGGQALRSAQVQASEGLHNWACFAAEQAAQLCMKAFLHGLGAGPWGHDLMELGRRARELGGDLWPDVDEQLRRLSRHYIPARYPEHMLPVRRESTTVPPIPLKPSRTLSGSSRPSGRSGKRSSRPTMTAERDPDRTAAARSVLDRRQRQRDDLIGEAKAFARALDPVLGVRSVVVFGSVARGDFNVWSDIDLLVVADRLPERPQDRAAVCGIAPRISVVAWTPDEFDARLDRRDPIALEAVEAGILVAGAALVVG